MKKSIIGMLITILFAWGQLYIVGGINGLTLVSIPLTLFLGIHVTEKLEDNQQTK